MNRDEKLESLSGQIEKLSSDYWELLRAKFNDEIVPVVLRQVGKAFARLYPTDPRPNHEFCRLLHVTVNPRHRSGWVWLIFERFIVTADGHVHLSNGEDSLAPGRNPPFGVVLGLLEGWRACSLEEYVRQREYALSESAKAGRLATLHDERD